jgi:putative NADH-flavin reductase
LHKRIDTVQVNGTLGTFVVAALVKAEFTVTILTTNAEKTAAAVPEASHTEIVQVDYVKEDLVPILRGQDAVVCLISRMVSKPHIVLADAAVEAGVPRIIPSSFGLKMDEDLRTNKALVDKWKTLDHVSSLVDAGKITSTAVQTSAFLDWALERGIFLNVVSWSPMARLVSGNAHYFEGCQSICLGLTKKLPSLNLQSCLRACALCPRQG